MLYLLLILVVLGVLAYYNRAALLVRYYNWQAKVAANKANEANALGDAAAMTKYLAEQRVAEAKAAAASKPPVSGEVKK